MKSKEQWLDEYSETHQNRANRLIHKICVPAILFSILGLLWQVPIPILNPIYPFNAALLLIFFSLLFYLRLGPNPFLVMASVALAASAAIHTLEVYVPKAPIVYFGLFVGGWVGQFVGHAIEGKRPSFLQDVQFLLIGPLWIFYR